MDVKFQKGDRVQWTSQAGGNTATKIGRIIEVLPPGKRPEGVKDAGRPRGHESYVVRSEYVLRGGAPKKENRTYWPLVKNLKPAYGVQDALLEPMSTGKEEKPTKKLVNHFVICLDRSGSMQPIQRQAVDTFNQNVKSIREGAEKSGQESTVSLVTFGGNVKTEHFCDPVGSLKTYDYQDFHPYGGTPLFDAVGTMIEKLLARKDSQDENVSYMFVVITDGEENISNMTALHLRSLMENVQLTDRWSFAFLLPPGYSRQFCARFGIPDGNVKEWEATAQGMSRAAQSVDVGINSYYTSRSQGMRSVTGFFTTDMTKVSVKDIESKLADIRNQVQAIEVNRTAPIRDFIESELKVPYITGRAFYQLVKDEKVQHHKKLMLRNRSTGAVYAGLDARQLLGLPDYLDVKVRPGNHADWDIFVQSTSVNRKLLPGTRLLYLV